MNKFTILYVDDEESNLRIFKDTFRRRFNVFTASSAKKGIEILENNIIDLVLSDQRMPEMTGVEFLKYSLEKHPGPNRILITGYSDIEAIESAINNARIFQYIQKPWKEERLLEVIEDALKLYHLERENEKQQKEIIWAKEKAEESNRLKTQFINNMSHEIRTPMNGIIGFTGLLKNDGLTSENKIKYIDVIQQNGNRLLKIIDNILEISKLGASQVKVVESEVCLNNLLSELFPIFNLIAKENNIPLYLKKRLSDEESTILTDSLKLGSVLSNLIENALKYTNEGFVEFGYELINNDLRLYIKDTGLGIHSESHRAIFDRFVQDQRSMPKIVSGLGLGLSIAKENAELINGKITLESEEGKGSTFFLTIPYRPVKLNLQQNNKSNTIENIGLTGTVNAYTVLIAEDEETNYLYLETIFNENTKSKWNILYAKNGEEAVELCKNNGNIDLVLMDLKMPIKTGYEATKEIKKHKPNLPIIAQTAYSTIEDEEKALSCGCDAFISKPIDIGVLFELINKNMK